MIEGQKITAAVPIVLADATDEQSLQAMTQQARVLINCVGPVKKFNLFKKI